MIHVPDVRATVEWYKSIGFEVVATYGDGTGENFSFAIMSFGETSDPEAIEIANDQFTHAVEPVAWFVDDVDSVFQRLVDLIDVVGVDVQIDFAPVAVAGFAIGIEHHPGRWTSTLSPPSPWPARC